MGGDTREPHSRWHRKSHYQVIRGSCSSHLAAIPAGGSFSLAYLLRISGLLLLFASTLSLDSCHVFLLCLLPFMSMSYPFGFLFTSFPTALAGCATEAPYGPTHP